MERLASHSPLHFTFTHCPLHSVHQTCCLGVRKVSLSLSLSLRFNSHFPGEPGLVGVYWSKGRWRWRWQLEYWSYKSCKAPVKSSPPTNQHPVFYRPDALPVAQPTVSKPEGKISVSMDLLTPSSSGGLPTLSLTINSSWLPWVRVAMSLISPLMPVLPVSARSYSL